YLTAPEAFRTMADWRNGDRANYSGSGFSARGAGVSLSLSGCIAGSPLLLSQEPKRVSTVGLGSSGAGVSSAGKRSAGPGDECADAATSLGPSSASAALAALVSSSTRAAASSAKAIISSA